MQKRASAMDSAYREKVNELRRYNDITSDLKLGIDRTDEELLRAEGDLQVKNEVAVRMKAKIDEMLVEIERVSVRPTRSASCSTMSGRWASSAASSS